VQLPSASAQSAAAAANTRKSRSHALMNLSLIVDGFARPPALRPNAASQLFRLPRFSRFWR
jgi:hypothetical protein